MKKNIFITLCSLSVGILMMSHSSGIGDVTNSPSETTCNTTGCHTSYALNSGTGSITITDNIPTSGYVPSQNYTVNITVAKTGVPLFGFDFEALSPLNATAGNITITDPGSTQLITPSTRQNITHVWSGGLSTGSKTFTFKWTAPSTNIGNITFYTAGLASNNSGTRSGDYVYTASKVISPSGLTTGTINGSPFCAGQTGISIPYIASGTFLSGNIFTAQISDALGSFTSPTNLGTLTATTSGTIISTSALPSVPGTAYRIRVIASNPVTTGAINGTNLTINAVAVTANAGSDQTVCSTSASLNGNTPSSGSGSWSLVSGSGTILSPANASSGFTGLGSGANAFRWTISNGSCTPSTDDVIITSVTPPTTANAGPDQTACLNSTTLAANTPTSGTGMWSLVSGSGTLISATSPNTTVTGLGNGINVFKWTISKPPCTPSTDNVNITVSGSITASNAGADQTVCGTSATLSGNAPSTGTGTWSLVSGSGIITASGLSTSGVTGLGSGTNTFRWTISNGSCSPSIDDVIITSVSPPTVAYAGPNQVACLNSTTLAANAPVTGTGTWSIVSGSGTFTSATSNNTTVTGLGAGLNVFKWTISNAPCSQSTSNVNITFSGAISSSNAGSDQTVCGATATLAGNVPTSGTGSWSMVYGAGNVTNPTNAASGVTGLGLGNNIFRWIISNGSCTPTTDEVTIVAVAPTTTANAGLDQSICNSSAIITGNVPTSGTGVWSIVSGGGTISAPSNPATQVTGLGTGQNIFRWTISNSPCASSTDDVTIDNCPGGSLSTNALSNDHFCSSSSYSLQIGFTSTGTFSGFYTAELSDSSGNFTNSVAIGSCPSSPISAFIPSNTPAGTGYRIRVINSSPATTGTDNGSNLFINTCNPNYITIDTLVGSPYCASTSYSINVPFIITGNLAGPFIAQLSDGSGSFAFPTPIGYNYSSPIAATIPSGTPFGINYRIKVTDYTTGITTGGNNSNLSINTCGIIGIKEYLEENEINIFPNPSQGILYLEFKNEQQQVEVEITNVLGESMLHESYKSIVPGTVLRVNVSDLPSNIYFIKFKSEHAELTKHFIKN